MGSERSKVYQKKKNKKKIGRGRSKSGDAGVVRQMGQKIAEKTSTALRKEELNGNWTLKSTG